MHRIPRASAVVATSAAMLLLAGASGPGGGGGAAARGAAGAEGDRAAVVRTVGKLVTERADGQYGVCSGAIVDSPSGSVIATAAHCLTSPESPRTPPRAWFAPGYDRVGPQQAIARGWRVRTYHTPPGWDVSRELPEILPHDYAFVTVEKRGGRSIRQAHGGNALAFAPIDAAREVVPLGYPVAPAEGAGPLARCSGTAELLTADSAHAANVGGLLLTSCGLTQGASGGPWLQDFDPVAQSGTLVGVMSVGSGDGEVLARPYPAAAGRRLLARADAAG